MKKIQTLACTLQTFHTTQICSILSEIYFLMVSQAVNYHFQPGLISEFSNTYLKTKMNESEAQIEN